MHQNSTWGKPRDSTRFYNNGCGLCLKYFHSNKLMNCQISTIGMNVLFILCNIIVKIIVTTYSPDVKSGDFSIDVRARAKYLSSVLQRYAMHSSGIPTIFLFSISSLVSSQISTFTTTSNTRLHI